MLLMLFVLLSMLCSFSGSCINIIINTGLLVGAAALAPWQGQADCVLVTIIVTVNDGEGVGENNAS